LNPQPKRNIQEDVIPLKTMKSSVILVRDVTTNKLLLLIRSPNKCRAENLAKSILDVRQNNVIPVLRALAFFPILLLLLFFFFLPVNISDFSPTVFTFWLLHCLWFNSSIAPSVFALRLCKVARYISVQFDETYSVRHLRS